MKTVTMSRQKGIKADAINALDPDSRRRYIYSGLVIADTIDGFIVQLIEDTERCHLYRQGFKAALNEMKREIESYKRFMNYSVLGSDEMRQELSNILDTLDDEFGNSITILFHSMKRYVMKFIANPDHAACIARASVIRTLSEYSLMYDEKVARVMSRATSRRIMPDNRRIKAIHHESGRYTCCFAQLYGKTDIDMNDCEEIFTAFTIIDKKMEKIHEMV